MDRLRHLIKSKFAKDGLWLIGSQLILSVCALLINIFISQKYSSAGFGVFNISFKVYLITSVLASFSTNVIVLRYISQFNIEKEREEKCLSTAFTMALFFSLLVMIAGILLCFFITKWVGKETLQHCLIVFFIGIPFFVLNKFYFNVLNGLRKMQLFAFLQALRWVLLAVGVITFSALFSFSLWKMCLFFPVTECVLFMVSTLAVKPYFKTRLTWKKGWITEHFHFGWQSVSSYAITEIHNYSDVVVLGIFTNMSTVGLYSFAADIAKNLFAFTDILQTNFNPIITELWWKNKYEELNSKIKQLRNFTYLLYAPVCLLSVFAYSVLIRYFLNDSGYTESYYLFIILCLGVFLFSGIRPSMAILELCGFQQLKLKINIVALFMNILLNGLLAFFYGITGIALATVFSYLIYALLLDFTVQKKIKITLLTGWRYQVY
ncbi:hypothetical protein FLAV_01602 [Flavobacteriales bacterium]|nr:hypothetical protein [Flavobacteriales bacterium]MCL4815977.1 oligosaccharide flippase family protein [Flavobacteriales bacterium]WKZ74307.1 MAG: oligosaccharide flippase family protein [Vicingaceae bacterium]CAG0977858.1 hypothetical protein FLAV_01602 [Flavobacteriales bacterium]